MISTTRLRAAIASLTLALALAGCDVRQDAAPDPAPTPAPAPSLTAPPTSQSSETPVASIIRPDALPGPIVDLPTPPFEATVPFAQGGSDLSPGAERVLAEVLRSDAIDEGWPVVLRGHTDSGGDDRANLRASRARAEAVAAWLVEHGVDDDRIEVIAMGEQNPVAPNALPDGEPNESGRAKNRRVEIGIAPPAPGATSSDGAADEGEEPPGR